MRPRIGILFLGLCLGLLALTAAPARADVELAYIVEGPSTPNRFFVVFSDFGGFEESTMVTVVNIAATDIPEGAGLGSVFLDPVFISSLGIDPNGRSFFGFGVFSDPEFSDHEILSADLGEAPNPLDPAFESFLTQRTMNMGFLDGNLEMPGGIALLYQSSFEDFFTEYGEGEEQIYNFLQDLLDPETGEIRWDMTSSFSAGMGEENIFIFPVPGLFIGSTAYMSQNGSLSTTFTPAPEPGLASLALAGLAMAFLRRRRRRAA